MSGNFSIPHNSLPVLNSDGTMHRVWYNYLQSLSGVAGAPQVNSVAAETKPPDASQTGNPDEVAEPSATAHTPAPSSVSSTGSSENDTEPMQGGTGNVVTMVQQLLANYIQNGAIQVGATPSPDLFS